MGANVRAQEWNGSPQPESFPAQPVYQMARPFDTGPHTPQRWPQLTQPARTYAPAPWEDPYLAAEAAGGSVTQSWPVESGPYVYDDFGHRPAYQAPPPAWFSQPWLWPLSNYLLTWIPGDGDHLGIFEMEKRLYLDHPWWGPLRVEPGFATRYFTGPDRIDLAPAVGDVYLEINSQWEIAGNVRLDVGIRPGFYGDFEYLNYDTFRLQGHAIAAWQAGVDSEWVAGFAYLAREDIQALPVGGWVWTPSQAARIELVFPRPRLAFKIQECPTLERWVYTGMELGGGSWSVLREDTRDVATYRDIRWGVGVETHLTSGLSGHLEVGWVFFRKLSFASGAQSYHPNDGVMIRAGLAF